MFTRFQAAFLFTTQQPVFRLPMPTKQPENHTHERANHAYSWN
nr:hypothetical protein [uncultured Kingella sp.]